MSFSAGHKPDTDIHPQEGVISSVMNALMDDINTPVAQASVYDALKSLNDLMSRVRLVRLFLFA